MKTINMTTDMLKLSDMEICIVNNSCIILSLLSLLVKLITNYISVNTIKHKLQSFFWNRFINNFVDNNLCHTPSPVIGVPTGQGYHGTLQNK